MLWTSSDRRPWMYGWLSTVGCSIALALATGLVITGCGGAGGSATPVAPPSPAPASSPSGVSVQVEGLAVGASLQLFQADQSLSITGNGRFAFQTPPAVGSAYSVGLKAQPSGQHCAITDGAGVFASTASSAVAVRCAAVASTHAFAPVAQGLVNLEPLYASFCPAEVQDNRSMQHVVPIDLNRDGRQDLIVYLWCSPVVGGNDFAGPTPSRIRALLQDEQGHFVDRTADVFGEDVVQPGGVGEYYVVGDFNRDGDPDIIWSLNREDGRRIQNPPVTQYVRNIALMSQGRGRYAMTAFGNPSWGFGVAAFDNASGGQDFITASVSEGQKAWTHQSGTGLVPLAGFDWVDSTGPMFFSRPGPGSGSQMAVLTVQQPQRIGLDLHIQSNGIWNKSPGGFHYPTSVIRKLCCNNREPSGAVFVQLDGKDYVDPSFAFTCAFRRSPTSTAEALTVFGANEIIGGYTGQVIVYNQTPLLELFKIMAFGITADQKLERRPLTIRNEVERDVKANRMSCTDINGDGHDDVVLHVTKSGQLPVLYLNDRNGSLDRVGSAAVPTSPAAERASNYLLADLDGDGIPELIYFPINAYAGSENRILVHKGIRRLSAADVMK